MNDAPVFTDNARRSMFTMGSALGTYFMPHVPNDLTDYEGFLVSDFIGEYFTDMETDTLGIAIYGAQSGANTGKKLVYVFMCMIAN